MALERISIAGLGRSHQFDVLVRKYLTDDIDKMLDKAQYSLRNVRNAQIKISASFFDDYIVIAGRAMQKMELYDTSTNTTLENLSARIYHAIDGVAKQIACEKLDGKTVTEVRAENGILSFIVVPNMTNEPHEIVFKSKVSSSLSKY